MVHAWSKTNFYQIATITQITARKKSMDLSKIAFLHNINITESTT